MSATRWSYVTAFCYFKTNPGLDLKVMIGGLADGFWAINLEREYPLHEGLNVMGSRGYELAGMQLTQMLNGGTSAAWYRPSYIYVFKRPEDG